MKTDIEIAQALNSMDVVKRSVLAMNDESWVYGRIQEAEVASSKIREVEKKNQ